jgi:cellulose synthase/poly-beta-1,6-N-acetylglucosamine synthase-like glycosyltransferase
MQRIKMSKFNNLYKYQNYNDPYVYRWILILWLIIMLIFEFFTFRDGVFPTYQSGHPIYAGLIVFNQLFVGMFFYFSSMNLIFPIIYQREKNGILLYENNVLNTPLADDFHPRVLLLYTTYNDFLPYAADQCFHQTYDNCQPIILDNSNDQESIKQIRQYVKMHPEVHWVQDQTNQHAKAGNLDNYLCNEGQGTYDYFVILDSDELLQPDFVEKALKFFQYANNRPEQPLGILQANHLSGQNINRFQSLFAASGDSFWPVQNAVRSISSGLINHNADNNFRFFKGDCVNIELGHGTMVSKECFESVGKIPWAVAEDLCFSFEALMKGFNIRFVHQIYGNESFPINQEALTIRSAKFCSANFEFFKRYGKQLFKTDLLTRCQKLDLLSFTLSVPLFAFEYISLILGSIVFPLAHVNTGGQAFFLIPTLVAYFSQSITDGWFQKHAGWSFWHVLKYEILSAFLYGNMYYVTFKSTILACLGVPAKFNVTPKESEKITFKDAFCENFAGILFSFTTIVVAILCSGSSWILLSFVPGVFGFLVYNHSNHEDNQNQQTQEMIDKGNQYALTKKDGHVVPWNL